MANVINSSALLRLRLLAAHERTNKARENYERLLVKERILLNSYLNTDDGREVLRSVVEPERFNALYGRAAKKRKARGDRVVS